MEDVRIPEWINYHHLLYFRTVAREGSITRASELLGLAQPTISGQIRALEETLGSKLFMRKGRNLVMTDFGRRVFGYADQIFTIGEEMGEALRGTVASRKPVLRVGATRTLPESLLYALVRPAVHGDGWLATRTDGAEQLLAALTSRSLDVVFADTTVGSGARSGTRAQVLGSTGVVLMGTPQLSEPVRNNLLEAMSAAPLLMPGSGSAIRLALEGWMVEFGLTPKTVAEIESETLALQFALNGAGLVAVPSLASNDVQQRTGLQIAAELPDSEIKIYAIATENSFAQPSVARTLDAARQALWPQLAATC